MSKNKIVNDKTFPLIKPDYIYHINKIIICLCAFDVFFFSKKSTLYIF